MPEGPGDIYTDLNTSAVNHDFFAAGPGNINNELNAGNIGGKQRNDNASLTVGGDFIQGLTDLFIGDGISFLFHVGGIG